MHKKHKISACVFVGVRPDPGNPLGGLKATLAFALNHPDIGPQLREYLSELL